MRVYFTASLFAKEKLEKHYRAIVKVLEEAEHKVYSDHVLGIEFDFVKQVSDEFRIKYYKEMIKKISSSDLVVADISHPSISIGHEASIALEKGKPLVVLCHEDYPIAQIFLGIGSEKLQVVKYNEKNLREKLLEVLEQMQGKMDVRFNFFISPEIGDYLDWIAKAKRVPRAVYLRRLLEEEMAKNKEFLASKS